MDDAAIVIGVNGSYARREATSGSDVDLFVLYDDIKKSRAKDCQRRFREWLEEAGYKMPAEDGVFSSPQSVKTTIKMIGGQKDTNKYITRRMLLLLEGEWIFNENKFASTRQQLLEEYVSNSLRKKQICLFLLNDIIRYWRTICVDFEFKMRDRSKSREIRLIKLRFSRMLLFVAGVLAVGETYNRDAGEKLETLKRYFSLPPIERIQEIAGEDATGALELYAVFLKSLDDVKIRQALSAREPAPEDRQVFEDLRGQAQEFRGALLGLIRGQYEGDNPTLNALVL